ncbi:hypothetical protein BDV36DRAFT_59026 [Aspergillus pseudocaelatus]|uniref:Secreted protein n=1 Tax=Aspergillus pseudocaelatus TaxID=1825620 RepID=A0ABQ6WW59_9EURO|nr:hypothetical protein BDV36DRAFT_59026 [Aspergillus pseudocaelatus]
MGYPFFSFLFFLASLRNTLLKEDMLETGPHGGDCNDTSCHQCIHLRNRKLSGEGLKRKKAALMDKRKKKKNIQQEGFAGGHPPNY